MEALILAIIITYAIKKAVEEGKLHWQKSKGANRSSTHGQSIPKRAASAAQHDIGYWANQLFSGFPTARHGFSNGWLAGRTAQTESHAAREKAKADHLEKRAGLIPELREHRRRQDEALERIRAAEEPEPEPVPDYGDDPAWNGEGFTAPVGDGGEGTPEETSQEASPSTSTTEEGTGMATAQASEVTYDGVLRHVTMAQDFEEAALAERQGKAAEASNISEQMQALGVDPATLGAMADYLDAMDEAAKAQQRAMEAAQSVGTNLQRGHAGLAEAHKDAPVRAADRPFYDEG